jgi:hypothetical protein
MYRQLNHTLRFLMMAGYATLATTGPFSAQAASISFTPTGSQLDTDSILDIAMTPGQTISFNIFVDPSGLFTGGSTANLNLITYDVFVDTNELTFVSATHPAYDPTGDVIGGEFLTHAQRDMGTNFGVMQDRDGFGVSTGPPGITLAPTLLDTLTYTATGNLDNDGVSDFRIALAAATTNTSVTNLFNPSSQQVEVQPSPAPEAGTTALTGLGFVALGFMGFRRSIIS